LNHFFTVPQEVEQLQYLEETTLSSDLAQGFALKALTGEFICIVLSTLNMAYKHLKLCDDSTCILTTCEMNLGLEVIEAINLLRRK
jgi:hypothetical protein